jgi:hypothetical protein
MIRDADGRIIRTHYVLPRHKAANWVGTGRGRTSTRPGANGVVELTPFEFLDRLVDLVPPPRKHRHRYHGVFALNHKLRRAVTAMAIGNIGKRREAATGGHAAHSQPTDGCCERPATRHPARGNPERPWRERPPQPAAPAPRASLLQQSADPRSYPPAFCRSRTRVLSTVAKT